MHELNFIPLSYRKNVTLPKVIFEPKLEQLYGGYYNPNTQTIVVVEDDNNYTDSTLAHEYRHHLQHYYGHTMSSAKITDSIYENYNLFIRNYFRNSWSEMDALIFQVKISPRDYCKFWLKGLVLPQVLDPKLQQ